MNSLFERLITECNGMLSPAAYEEIYNFAARGGLIVEIGTSFGAGTAALACGLRDSGKEGRIISFDPRTKGARAKQVEENLSRFGIGSLVTLVGGGLPECIDAIEGDEPISVLMLDADGRIDRDLMLLYDRITLGGAIIIDDNVDLIRLKMTSWSTFGIDSKMKLTHLLVRYLMEKRFITPGINIKNTYFGKKMNNSSQDIDLNDIIGIYRELVFTSARLTPIMITRGWLLQKLTLLFPSLLQRLRVWHRRRVKRPA